MTSISVVIPARNEERMIATTVRHALAACDHYRQTTQSGKDSCEVIVVDNASTDGTLSQLDAFLAVEGFRIGACAELGAARARNLGADLAFGTILVFVDADTLIPADALIQIVKSCGQRLAVAGIGSLSNLDGGVRSNLWWAFWNAVRLLPLARAKAMPALMFCTSAAFQTYGPFDETVAIGEEWPILAGLYRVSRRDVIYARHIVGRSSSRRMDQMPFGYSRTFLKYVWAILHRSGRIHYTDRIR